MFNTVMVIDRAKEPELFREANRDSYELGPFGARQAILGQAPFQNVITLNFMGAEYVTDGDPIPRDMSKCEACGNIKQNNTRCWTCGSPD